jgi:DNA-binding beta-propeller fold protein YncE
MGITVDRAGDIYVADWRNDRVQKFDAEGKFVACYGTPGRGDGEFCRPAGVAVDLEGNLYVADWGNERVQVLAPGGSFVAKFRGEADLSKWTEGYFKANQEEFAVRLKADLEPKLNLPSTGDPRQESASIEKLFWGPTAVKIDDQGRIYVVDSCRFRIQVYCRGSCAAC